MVGQERSWWLTVSGPELAQGDYLPNCMVPYFEPKYGAGSGTEEVPVKNFNCIVVTQSCDLANQKAELVALCPTYCIEEYELANPKLRQKGAWEQVRRGKVEGLHMMASMANETNNKNCLIADFRQIYSLPHQYLQHRAQSLENRSRLRSPYLEHFSQAFARFFMRVGLPSSIPPF